MKISHSLKYEDKLKKERPLIGKENIFGLEGAFFSNDNFRRTWKSTVFKLISIVSLAPALVSIKFQFVQISLHFHLKRICFYISVLIEKLGSFITFLSFHPALVPVYKCQFVQNSLISISNVYASIFLSQLRS
uniref:Uncharacterized protein n=1 Tax=Cacopsylla melanoneura TaxID=428564 RepID=A0A8D8VI31_9HEMI